MHVRWLDLVGFRGFASLSFAPDPGLNALVGPNGQGKTSLLEGLHVLVAGRSFRTARLVECVGFEAAEAVVSGELAEREQSRAVRLTLAGRGDGVALRGGLCPWARAVTFAAGDVGLVAGGPPFRRVYLDGVAAKLVPAHGEACRRYRVVLQQRARLLGTLRGRADAERLLLPWDAQVAALGSEITHRRLEVLAVLVPEVHAVARALSPRGPAVEVAYVPAVEPGADRAETERRLLAALGGCRPAELRRGVTLVGPHRDDLVLRLGRADARTAASRGEQRLLALTLRLAEAATVRRRLGVPPVFLLDDVLSDLDRGARERVLAWLGGQGQVLFSATDTPDLDGVPGTVWEVRGASVGAPARVGARGAA